MPSGRDTGVCQYTDTQELSRACYAQARCNNMQCNPISLLLLTKSGCRGSPGLQRSVFTYVPIPQRQLDTCKHICMVGTVRLERQNRWLSRRSSYCEWKFAGKPREGELCRSMWRSRQQLKKWKNNKAMLLGYKLVENLEDGSHANFWRKLNREWSDGSESSACLRTGETNSFLERQIRLLCGENTSVKLQIVTENVILIVTGRSLRGRS